MGACINATTTQHWAPSLSTIVWWWCARIGERAGKKLVWAHTDKLIKGTEGLV